MFTAAELVQQSFDQQEDVEGYARLNIESMNCQEWVTNLKLSPEQCLQVILRARYRLALCEIGEPPLLSSAEQQHLLARQTMEEDLLSPRHLTQKDLHFWVGPPGSNPYEPDGSQMVFGPGPDNYGEGWFPKD